MAVATPRDPYLRLHAVNVYVRDQERSLRFYLDQLGFQLAFDACLPSGQRWLAVSPPDGTAVLTLIAPPPDSPEHKLIGRATHVVFVTEDVLATYREWGRRGVRFRHVPRLRRVRYQPHQAESAAGSEAPWGGVFTRFEDVDRNSFALVSFDELSRAVEAQRRVLAEKQEAERRSAQELEIAMQVQARLFPQTLPALATLEYAGLCMQARQVGGDYYDFLELDRGRVALVVGDIAGKGIAAALLMANLQASLRSRHALALAQLADFLCSVKRLFCENTADGAYATLFFAEYDDHTRRLRYANCGHLPALLLRRDGSLERLHSTATVLGLFTEWDCSVHELNLLPEDVLLLYTDGITESFNAAEEEFGEQRLVQTLRSHCAQPPQTLLQSVIDEVRRFSPHEQGDDITLIVAKVR
jgi:serine phosphatase RsbU (regulator of sigma subunit)